MKCDEAIGGRVSSPGRRAGRTWCDGDGAPPMVSLPGGEFTMGETGGDKFADDTERPSHKVRIPSGEAMGRFPVTVGEFRRFHPGHLPEDAGELPLVLVNWSEACGFCGWLTERTGRCYRLSSEAEWEFACRAGSRTPFSCGDEMTPATANFLYDEGGVRVGPGGRTPGGRFAPNAFGLCDLHGNVNEWVADAWHPNYLGAPADGRAWAGPGDGGRVVRGGAWDYLPRLLRSAWRDWRPAEYRADNVGFRVATADLETQGVE